MFSLELFGRLISDIEKRIQNTNTYLASGDRIDCCDELKKTDNSRNYWKTTIVYPKTPFTSWWIEQWGKIFPEILDRIEDRDTYYALLPINSLPVRENRYYKQHFIWTLLRSGYMYPFFQSVKLLMDKHSDLEFLPVLRFFSSVNHLNVGRFISEKGYFSLNIEKAQRNFAQNDCKFMWRVFSGVNAESIDFNIFKSVHGIHDRIRVLNEYYAIYDWLSDLDQSGVYIYSIDNKTLKLNYLAKVLQFQDMSGYSGNVVKSIESSAIRGSGIVAVTDESVFKSYFSRL
jgi:hypothetical protein